jgi:hypothetical protein
MYERVPVVKIQDPDCPENFLLVNQADYGPGKQYDPSLFPLFHEAPPPPPPAPPAKASATKKG